jgi:hypothetical protein
VSVHVLSWVFQNSEAEAGERLVLLVLANFADESGLSWPGVARIAREARLSERQVQRCLRKLERDGCIVTVLNGAPDNRQADNRRTNAYRIIHRGDTSVTSERSGVTSATFRGDIRGGLGVTPASPKPSLNRQEPRRLHPEAEAALLADLAAVDSQQRKDAGWE